jgi:hypothetical protein
MSEAWERQSSETDDAFAAFVLYRDLGPSRTIEQAHDAYLQRNKHKAKERVRSGKKKGQGPTHWADWSARFKWVERVRAYDDHIDSIALEERQKATAAEAAKWAKRRMAQRDREWDIGEQLQAKAQQLLTQELEARAGDSARLAESGSKLARLAAGMETDHTKVTGAIAVMEVDLSDKDDDELRAYLGALADAAERLAKAS